MTDMPDEYQNYQDYLDQFREAKKRYTEAGKVQGNLESDSNLARDMDVAFEDLMNHQYLPKTPRQNMETKFLAGDYHRLLDLRYPAADHNWQRIDYLGRAADYFESAAHIAETLEDWISVSRYKFMAAGAYAGSKAFRARYRPAFRATREAMSAWFRLSSWRESDELTYAFTLADNLALRATIVGEDRTAVEGLELAAFIQFQLNERTDFPFVDRVRHMLFLEWDWATLYSSMGYFRHAFRQIMRARHDLLQAVDEAHPLDALLSTWNRLRLERGITAMALNLAEMGMVSDSSYRRLLRVAEKQLRLLRALGPTNGDPTIPALTLLAYVKWGALTGRVAREKRMNCILKAQRMAIALNDINLFAQVQIARGDEYAFQGRYRLAREFYEKAERKLRTIGCEDRARLARMKLSRLPQSAFDGDDGDTESPSWGPSLN